MPLASTDIKLFASARMSDAPDGGGPMSADPIQDGAENDLFPDLSHADFAHGRLQLRKIYGAVMTNNRDTLLGAGAVLQDISANTEVNEFLVLAESAAEEREDVIARLQVSHWEPLGPGGDASLEWINASTLRSTAFVPQVGMVIYTKYATGSYGTDPVLLTGVTSAGGSDYTVTYHGSLPMVGIGPWEARLGVPSTTSPRLAVCKPVQGALAIGATYCDVDSVLVQLVPKTPGVAAGTADKIGIDAVPVVPQGIAVGIRSGDGLVVHHTAPVGPASYTNGQVVATRPGVSAMRLVGADLLAIDTGWTWDPVTGNVTMVNVAGWQQPVTIYHTIEEVLACGRIGYSEVSGGSTGLRNSEVAGPFALSPALEMYCGRPNVGRLRVISKDGLDITDRMVSVGSISARAFDVNLIQGTATVGQWSATFAASHSPVRLVSSGVYYTPSVPTMPQTTLNRVTFNRALTKAFPAGSFVSSVLHVGDLQAQVGRIWSQETWTNVWGDQLIGNAPTADYNATAYPITTSNLGAVTDRLAVVFTNNTQFRVIGEVSGQLAVGNTATDLTITNPATGGLLLHIPALGWGGGWSGGNALRINLRGALAPWWVGRSTKPSVPYYPLDSLLVALRGDRDA